MAWQVAEGITYLHRYGIIHRDLKSMNIVLDNELNCKVCDFGMSVTLERSHLTVPGMQGSPRYLAPEQFEARARITERVDIWQMGCVMLELFCHKIPYRHLQDMTQFVQEIVVKQINPEVPDKADPMAKTLVEPCFRREPSERPTASALEEALRGLLRAFDAVKM